MPRTGIAESNGMHFYKFFTYCKMIIPGRMCKSASLCTYFRSLALSINLSFANLMVKTYISLFSFVLVWLALSNLFMWLLCWTLCFVNCLLVTFARFAIMKALHRLSVLCGLQILNLFVNILGNCWSYKSLQFFQNSVLLVFFLMLFAFDIMLRNSFLTSEI